MRLRRGAGIHLLRHIRWSGPRPAFHALVCVAGALVRFNGQRVLDKWTDLKVAHATSIAVNDAHVICGCSDGVVRLFAADSMACLLTLPLPAPLGAPFDNGAFSECSASLYPHIIALGMDMNTEFVTCIYNDRSLRVWRLVQPDDIRLHACFPFHSAGVCDVQIVERDKLDTGSAAQEIVTVSADKSMRLWQLSPGARTGICEMR